MGAWDQYYQRGTRGDAGSAVGYGCVAVKRELVFNGFSAGVDPATLVIGNAASEQIRAFQAARALEADGVVGPITARALFKSRELRLERKYSIPDRLVCQIIAQESNFDPGAVNEASADFGIVQIHAASHPTITLAEAFSPEYAMEYLASSLQTMFLKLRDWDCAVAAWHVGGGGASDWCGMGKPSTGGPTWNPTLFAEATKYIADVRGQTGC